MTARVSVSVRTGLVLLAGALILSAPVSVFASTPLPTPTGYVSDFAGILSEDVRAALESELVAFNASTTSEIAVVTVTSMDGDYIEHYAAELFKTWGIGTEKNDNGILLLVAMDERMIRIEAGYGLEGALPDSLADQIITNDITPAFRDGDYGTGIEAGVRAIAAATQGEYAAPAGSTSDFSFDPIALIVFGFVALEWLAAILARSKSVWLGGILGALLGVAVSTVFSWWVFAGVLFTVLIAGLGIALDMAVSNAYTLAKASGARPPWWAGGSGGFGGSSGGSFGGFGGGMSGGGGASGRF